MILKDIISISGEPGLFKFIAQGKNAIIIEHLETGKRTSAYSSAKVSSLDDISVFAESEDIPLGKVFDRIYERENGGPAISSKSDPASLKNYFNEVVPDYSKDRVYVSDMKKIVQWYNILQKNDLLKKEEPEVAAEPEVAEAATKKPAAKKPAAEKAPLAEKKTRKAGSKPKSS